MPEPLEVQFISITINRPFTAVNEFLAAPENFELWAAGLGNGFRQLEGEWLFGSPESPAKIRFTPKNEFGIADHFVYPPSGGEVYVPLRAVPNGDGTEVTLSLFRQPGMSDQQFAEDQGAVRRDLEALKIVLEG